MEETRVSEENHRTSASELTHSLTLGTVPNGFERLERWFCFRSLGYQGCDIKLSEIANYKSPDLRRAINIMKEW